jgi:DNA-binding beta-propeller fold protein YncE
MTGAPDAGRDFAVGYYAGNRRTGSIAVVRRQGGKTTVQRVAVAPPSRAKPDRLPVFIGLTDDLKVILLDPVRREIQLHDRFPVDAFPAHIYTDPRSGRNWYMNDGDKQTGNDTLNCGDEGSSVTVVENPTRADAKWLATICVGRGHHQAVFTYPSEAFPDTPARAWITNLMDGTISAIGNDPADPDTYLKVVATLNLCQPEKEDATEPFVPNKAFPHGLVHSPLTGRLYALANGYGTISVIDPRTAEIERRMDFKGHSNLFISPDGRYVIGRGVDRKSDPEHVAARLTALDLTDGSVTDKADLPDIYIEKYFYNAEGTKLYLNTGKSGSDEQKANIRANVLLVIDLTALPRVRVAREVPLERSTGSVCHAATDGRTDLMFAADPEMGTVTVIDGAADDVLETVRVMPGTEHSRIWNLGA